MNRCFSLCLAALVTVLANAGGSLAAAPKLADALRKYFPGFRLPTLAEMEPATIEGSAAGGSRNTVPFVCTGDFDGNGLPDVALVLVGRRGHYRVAAFHQRRDGSFIGYRLYGGHGDDSGWTMQDKLTVSLTRQPKGPIEYMEGDYGTGKLRLRHDAVSVDWFGAAARVYYFTGRRYDYVQTGD